MSSLTIYLLFFSPNIYVAEASYKIWIRVHPRNPWLLLLVHVSSRQFHLLVYNADNIWKLEGRKYFFHQRRGYSTTNTNITLRRKKHRHFFATNTDISLPPTRIYYYATNTEIILPPIEILLHQQQRFYSVNNPSTSRYYSASKTDIASPPAQTLLCQQHKYCIATNTDIYPGRNPSNNDFCPARNKEITPPQAQKYCHQ